MAGAAFDMIVVGAGAVGLAIARAAALSGASVLITERAGHFGTETSSRNSEVIHAGIYYPSGSLKAQLCVAGRDMLYEFCAAHGVPHRRCGKLIVAANDAQMVELQRIKAAAAACSAGELRLLEAQDIHRIEPEVLCHAGLFSPLTGILDTHAYMQALLGVAEAHGATLVCNTEVTRITPTLEGWAITIAGSDAPVASAPVLVNAAGLGAQAMARAIQGFPSDHVPALRYAKGCYFGYGGKTPFSHLVYPLPEPGGLGTHLTLDMAGRARFGPNVEWIDAVEYSVDPAHRDRFAESVRRFWPGVDTARLYPDYAGVRPKLSGPGEAAMDFVISGPSEHGVPGIVNLFGIESPGITASLAIADHVLLQLREAA